MCLSLVLFKGHEYSFYITWNYNSLGLGINIPTRITQNEMQTESDKILCTVPASTLNSFT